MDYQPWKLSEDDEKIVTKLQNMMDRLVICEVPFCQSEAVIFTQSPRKFLCDEHYEGPADPEPYVETYGDWDCEDPDCPCNEPDDTWEWGDEHKFDDPPTWIIL